MDEKASIVEQGLEKEDYRRKIRNRRKTKSLG